MLFGPAGRVPAVPIILGFPIFYPIFAIISIVGFIKMGGNDFTEAQRKYEENYKLNL